ncbi:hypothetical protein [Actinopolymorpha pittospori]
MIDRLTYPAALAGALLVTAAGVPWWPARGVTRSARMTASQT